MNNTTTATINPIVTINPSTTTPTASARINSIQARINAVNHVSMSADTYGTIHHSKQALYNRMFQADNFAKYQPIGNESKFELLTNYSIHIGITYHCLKNLASKGNLNAMELMRGTNHTVSMEDLQQEVLLWFVEYEEEWEIDSTGKVDFLSDDTVKALFTCVSGYLRRFQTKHFKHQYIELDGQIVDVTKVSQLADYVSMEELLNDIDLQTFMDKLTTTDRTWLEYRLQGESNRQIALAMNVTYEKIRAIEKRVRKMWNDNN